MNRMSHFANNTPLEWTSGHQSTVETAECGSKFVGAKNCAEQLEDIRNTLRHMGAPVFQTAHMFGDDKSVEASATIPHAELKKQNAMLSFHCVREATAGNILHFVHVVSKMNHADTLSKHWKHTDVQRMLTRMPFQLQKGRQDT